MSPENQTHYRWCPYKAFLLRSRKLIALIQVYIFTKSISQVYTAHRQNPGSHQSLLHNKIMAISLDFPLLVGTDVSLHHFPGPTHVTAGGISHTGGVYRCVYTIGSR